MKGFSKNVDGPKGPWYKKVNEVVSKAMQSNDPAFIIELLGEPNLIEKVEEEDRIPDGNSEVDPRYPEVYWSYFDPYRPRKMYKFGISGNTIVERSHVTKSI